MRAVLKRKNEHRHTFPAEDTIIEESYPVGYEAVDQEHKKKRPDLKGQFIYAALVNMMNKKGKRENYIVTIKLDDSHADKKAQFKDISVKKRSLYVGQTQNSNSVNVNPPADRILTIQQIVDFVKNDFKDSPLFTENIPPVIPEKSSGDIKLSIAEDSMTEEEFADLESNEQLAEQVGNGIRFSLVTDSKTIDRLDAEEKAGDYITTYRALYLSPEDGKLHSPMAVYINGKLGPAIELGKWEKSDEHPELLLVKIKGKEKYVPYAKEMDTSNLSFDKNGELSFYFGLKQKVRTRDKKTGKIKTEIKTIYARYNPYLHSATTMLNDQFKKAYLRPGLVVVEVRVPKSELNSNYHAEFAKDPTGMLDWNSGTVQNKLKSKRRVMLSRWDKPVRIVPDAEVAQHIKGLMKGEEISIPANVVTPGLRAELEKIGVTIDYTSVDYDPDKEIISEDSGAKFSFTAMDAEQYAVENKLPDVPDGIDLKSASQVRNYLREAFAGRKFRIDSDGRLVAIDFPGIRSGVEKRGKSRQSLFDMENIVKNSYPVGYEFVDLEHLEKSQDINGQFIYVALINVDGQPFVATIKLNDHYNEEYAKFKDIGIKEMASAVRGSNGRNNSANPPAQMPRYTIHELVDFVKQNFKENSRFTENILSDFSERLDQAYFSAVNRGDMKTAQKMVENAAKRAGYSIKAYHGTNAEFYVFDTSKIGLFDNGSKFRIAGVDSNGKLIIHTIKDEGFFFSAQEAVANDHAEGAVELAGGSPRTIAAYLKAEKPLIIEMDKFYAEKKGYDTQDWYDKHTAEILDRFHDGDYDGIWVKNPIHPTEDNLYIVFTPEQIKSAAPVTYDDNGNVIPLSERFNTKKDDIRFAFSEESDIPDISQKEMDDRIDRAVTNTVAPELTSEERKEKTESLRNASCRGIFFSAHYSLH